MIKSKRIYSVVFVAGLALGLGACEDEVLVETKDETKANELLAAIAAADEQLATLSVENNTLIVSNEEAEDLIDQYHQLVSDLEDPYSQPSEVHYTVTVLSSANAVVSSGRSKGLDGATVVVEQNGLVLEPSSVSGGLYLFTGLKAGYVYVRVSAPDHTSVEYRSYIYKQNGDDAASAESFNAQTQVILFPVSGDKAAKFVGHAYANTNVLNDTLNRRYGSIAAYGAKANTYISAPNGFSDYDYSHAWDGVSSTNLYGSTVYGANQLVGYENALEGHKIYAYPDVTEMANNDYESHNGRIYEIIYKGLVTSTTIAADGSFALPVVSSAQYADNGVVNLITLETEPYVAPHTRLTAWDGNYYGEANEAGSREVELQYYNNRDWDITRYTGTDAETVTIAPNTAASVKRRVITEDWVYYPSTLVDGEIGGWNENLPGAGETRNINIYFQPRERD